MRSSVKHWGRAVKKRLCTCSGHRTEERSAPQNPRTQSRDSSQSNHSQHTKDSRYEVGPRARNMWPSAWSRRATKGNLGGSNPTPVNPLKLFRNICLFFPV